MKWSDPDVLKEMDEIERVAATGMHADSADANEYARLMDDLKSVACGGDVHSAKSARVVLAVMPIIREYELMLRGRHLENASTFALGMIDGMANLVANMLRVNPPDLDAAFKHRFDRVTGANLEQVGRTW